MVVAILVGPLTVSGPKDSRFTEPISFNSNADAPVIRHEPVVAVHQRSKAGLSIARGNVDEKCYFPDYFEVDCRDRFDPRSPDGDNSQVSIGSLISNHGAE